MPDSNSKPSSLKKKRAITLGHRVRLDLVMILLNNVHRQWITKTMLKMNSAPSSRWGLN